MIKSCHSSTLLCQARHDFILQSTIIRSACLSTLNASNNNSSNSSPFKMKFIPNVSTSNNKLEVTKGKNNTKVSSPFKFKFIIPNPSKDNVTKRWASHTLPSKQILRKQQESVEKQKIEEEKRLEEAKKLINHAREEAERVAKAKRNNEPVVSPSANTEKLKKRKRTLRPRKAIITLSPNAIIHLKALLEQPEPKMIRVGTRNRGCSGTTYDLQYVTESGKFDEIVEQDGVKIIIDSKALFSVIGSEMDWLEDKLNSKFIFKNPNSKGTCGCGESFMT